MDREEELTFPISDSKLKAPFADQPTMEGQPTSPLLAGGSLTAAAASNHTVNGSNHHHNTAHNLPREGLLQSGRQQGDLRHEGLQAEPNRNVISTSANSIHTANVGTTSSSCEATTGTTDTMPDWATEQTDVTSHSHKPQVRAGQPGLDPTFVSLPQDVNTTIQLPSTSQRPLEPYLIPTHPTYSLEAADHDAAGNPNGREGSPIPTAPHTTSTAAGTGRGAHQQRQRRMQFATRLWNALVSQDDSSVAEVDSVSTPLALDPTAASSNNRPRHEMSDTNNTENSTNNLASNISSTHPSIILLQQQLAQQHPGFQLPLPSIGGSNPSSYANHRSGSLLTFGGATITDSSHGGGGLGAPLAGRKSIASTFAPPPDLLAATTVGEPEAFARSKSLTAGVDSALLGSATVIPVEALAMMSLLSPAVLESKDRSLPTPQSATAGSHTEGALTSTPAKFEPGSNDSSPLIDVTDHSHLRENASDSTSPLLRTPNNPPQQGAEGTPRSSGRPHIAPAPNSVDAPSFLPPLGHHSQTTGSSTVNTPTNNTSQIAGMSATANPSLQTSFQMQTSHLLVATDAFSGSVNSEAPSWFRGGSVMANTPTQNARTMASSRFEMSNTMLPPMAAQFGHNLRSPVMRAHSRNNRGGGSPQQLNTSDPGGTSGEELFDGSANGKAASSFFSSGSGNPATAPGPPGIIALSGSGLQQTTSNSKSTSSLEQRPSISDSKSGSSHQRPPLPSLTNSSRARAAHAQMPRFPLHLQQQLSSSAATAQPHQPPTEDDEMFAMRRALLAQQLVIASQGGSYEVLAEKLLRFLDGEMAGANGNGVVEGDDSISTTNSPVASRTVSPRQTLDDQQQAPHTQHFLPPLPALADHESIGTKALNSSANKNSYASVMGQQPNLRQQAGTPLTIAGNSINSLTQLPVYPPLRHVSPLHGNKGAPPLPLPTPPPLLTPPYLSQPMTASIASSQSAGGESTGGGSLQNKPNQQLTPIQRSLNVGASPSLTTNLAKVLGSPISKSPKAQALSVNTAGSSGSGMGVGEGSVRILQEAMQAIASSGNSSATRPIPPPPTATSTIDNSASSSKNSLSTPVQQRSPTSVLSPGVASSNASSTKPPMGTSGGVRRKLSPKDQPLVSGDGLPSFHAKGGINCSIKNSPAVSLPSTSLSGAVASPIHFQSSSSGGIINSTNPNGAVNPLHRSTMASLYNNNSSLRTAGNHTKAPPAFHYGPDENTFIGKGGGGSMVEAVTSLRESAGSFSHNALPSQNLTSFYGQQPLGVSSSHPLNRQQQGANNNIPPSNSYNRQQSSSSRGSSRGRASGGSRSSSRGGGVLSNHGGHGNVVSFVGDEGATPDAVSSNGLGSSSFNTFLAGAGSGSPNAILGAAMHSSQSPPTNGGAIVNVRPLSPQSPHQQTSPRTQMNQQQQQLNAIAPPAAFYHHQHNSRETIGIVPVLDASVGANNMTGTAAGGSSAGTTNTLTNTSNTSNNLYKTPLTMFTARHDRDPTILGVVPIDVPRSANGHQHQRPQSPCVSWSHTALNGQDPMVSSKSPTTSDSPSTGRQQSGAAALFVGLGVRNVGTHSSSSNQQVVPDFGRQQTLKQHNPDASNSGNTPKTRQHDATDALSRENFIGVIGLPSEDAASSAGPQTVDEKRNPKALLGVCTSNNSSVQEGFIAVSSPRQTRRQQLHNAQQQQYLQQPPSSHYYGTGSRAASNDGTGSQQGLYAQFHHHSSTHSLHRQSNSSLGGAMAMDGGGGVGYYSRPGGSKVPSALGLSVRDTSVSRSTASRAGGRKLSDEEQLLQSLRAKRQLVINNLIAQRNPAVAKALQELQKHHQNQQTQQSIPSQYMPGDVGMGFQATAQSVRGSGGGGSSVRGNSASAKHSNARNSADTNDTSAMQMSYYGPSHPSFHRFQHPHEGSGSPGSAPGSAVPSATTNAQSFGILHPNHALNSGGGTETLSEDRQPNGNPLSTSASTDDSAALSQMRNRQRNQRQMIEEREQRFTHSPPGTNLQTPQTQQQTSGQGKNASTPSLPAAGGPSGPFVSDSVTLGTLYAQRASTSMSLGVSQQGYPTTRSAFGSNAMSVSTALRAINTGQTSSPPTPPSAASPGESANVSLKNVDAPANTTAPINTSGGGMFFPAPIPIQLTPKTDHLPGGKHSTAATARASPGRQSGSLPHWNNSSNTGAGKRVSLMVPTYRDTSNYSISTISQTQYSNYGPGGGAIGSDTSGGAMGNRNNSSVIEEGELHAGGTTIITNTTGSSGRLSADPSGTESVSNYSPKGSPTGADKGGQNRFSLSHGAGDPEGNSAKSFSGWDGEVGNGNNFSGPNNSSNSGSAGAKLPVSPFRRQGAKATVKASNFPPTAPGSSFSPGTRALYPPPQSPSSPGYSSKLPAEMILANFMQNASNAVSTFGSSMGGFVMPMGGDTPEDGTGNFVPPQQSTGSNSNSGNNRSGIGGSARGSRNILYLAGAHPSSSVGIGRSPNEALSSIRIPGQVGSQVYSPYLTTGSGFAAAAAATAQNQNHLQHSQLQQQQQTSASVIAAAIAAAGGVHMGLSMSDFNPSMLYSQIGLGGIVMPGGGAGGGVAGGGPNLMLYRGSVRNKSLVYTKNMSFVGRSMSFASVSVANPNRPQREGREVSMMSIANNVPPTVMTTTSNYAMDDADGFFVLNNYILLTEAGQGQYGTVMIASTADSDSMKAIKIIPKSKIKPKFATLQKHRSSSISNESLHGAGVSQGSLNKSSNTRVQLSAFEREIAVMKKLRHRNIVRLEEVIDDPEDENLYLVMPYIERGPIVKMERSRCEPLDVDTIRSYMRQILSAVAYLHRHQVVHCDIKPDNILLGANGMVYLADFGVSEMFNNNAEEIFERSRGSREMEGKVLSDGGAPFAMTATKGTPAFAAPETLTGLAFDGSAADMWAVGVTLYVLLFGRLPFEGYSLRDLYRAVEGDPVDLCKAFRPRWEGLKVEFDGGAAAIDLVSPTTSEEGMMPLDMRSPAGSQGTSKFISSDYSEVAKGYPSSTTPLHSPTNSATTTAAPTPMHPSANAPNAHLKTLSLGSPYHQQAPVHRVPAEPSYSAGNLHPTPISPADVSVVVAAGSQVQSPLSTQSPKITDSTRLPKPFPKMSMCVDDRAHSGHSNPLAAETSRNTEDDAAQLDPSQLLQSYLTEIAALHALMTIRNERAHRDQKELDRKLYYEQQQEEENNRHIGRRTRITPGGDQPDWHADTGPASNGGNTNKDESDVYDRSVASSAPFSSPRPSQHFELGLGDTLYDDDLYDPLTNKGDTRGPAGEDTSGSGSSAAHQMREGRPSVTRHPTSSISTSASQGNKTQRKRGIVWSSVAPSADTGDLGRGDVESATVFNNFTFALPNAEQDSLHFADLRVRQVTEELLLQLMSEIKSSVRAGKTSEGEVVFPCELLSLGDEEEGDQEVSDEYSDTFSEVSSSSSSGSDISDYGSFTMKGDRTSRKTKSSEDKSSRSSALSIDSQLIPNGPPPMATTTTNAKEPRTTGRGPARDKRHKSVANAKVTRQELLLETAKAVLKQRVGKKMAAISLIRKLMTKDPAKRITAAEALRHPFITSSRWLGSIVPEAPEAASPFLERSKSATMLVGGPVIKVVGESSHRSDHYHMAASVNNRTLNNANSTTHTHVFQSTNSVKQLEGSTVPSLATTFSAKDLSSGSNKDDLLRQSSCLIPLIPSNAGREGNVSPRGMPASADNSFSPHRQHLANPRPDEDIVFTVGRNRNNGNNNNNINTGNGGSPGRTAAVGSNGGSGTPRGLQEITTAEIGGSTTTNKTFHNSNGGILTPRQRPDNTKLPPPSPLVLPQHPPLYPSPTSPATPPSLLLTKRISPPKKAASDHQNSETKNETSTSSGQCSTNDREGELRPHHGTVQATSDAIATPQTTTPSSNAASSPRPRGKEGVAGRHRQTIRDAITEDDVATSTVGRNWELERDLAYRMTVGMQLDENEEADDTAE